MVSMRVFGRSEARFVDVLTASNGEFGRSHSCFSAAADVVMAVVQ